MANKYQATRIESYKAKYWNGSYFTNDETKAKQFDSRQQCFDELAEKGALYFDRNRGKWVGQPVNCNPV